MNNDVVIITGVNGALGSALTKTYLNNAHNVIGIDKQKSTKHRIDYLQFDFSKITDLAYRKNKRKSLINLINKRQIKVLINNAAYQKISSFENIKFSDIEVSLNVNFKTPFFLIKTLLTPLIESGGKVINIGTIHNQLTIPNFFCYSSSKLAMSSIVKSLSVELGNKIDFIEISPGAIDTKMLRSGFDDPKHQEFKKNKIPSKKFLDPLELGSIIYNISISKNLNGSKLIIDGGASNLSS